MMEINFPLPYRGDPRTYDLTGSWTAIISQAVVSQTYIFHRHNAINGSSIPGNPFRNLKIPKLTTEMEEN
jgi:hypothetical protein